MKPENERSQQGFDRFVSLALLVCFLNFQVFAPCMVLAAEAVADFPQPMAQAVVVPMVLESSMRGLQPQERPEFIELQNPLTPVLMSDVTKQASENESRDREEYRFDDALDYLQPGIASAVIVESIEAKDLRNLTELGIEVGIAVLYGKIVLFTSGNKNEIRMLAPVKELLGEADLLAHVHPKGERAEPSLTDIQEAGESVEYVIGEEGVYAYNRDGLQNEYARDFGWLSRKIQGLQNRTVSGKHARDVLNALIKGMDDYNDNLEEGLLVRSADAPTVFPGQPVAGSREVGGASATLDRYSSNLMRLNYNISTAGSSAAAVMNFTSGPRNLSSFAKFTFEIRLPTTNCSNTACVNIQFVDVNNQTATVAIPGLGLDFRQVDVTRSQLLAANPALDLTRIKEISFGIRYGLGITHITAMEIKTGGLSTAAPLSAEGYPIVSIDALSQPLTVLPGSPVLNTTVQNGGTAVLNQQGEGSFSVNYTLPQTTSTAAGHIQFASPKNIGNVLVLSLSGSMGRQIKVQVHDATGKAASYYLNFSYLGSYTLNLTGSSVPAGFNTTQITKISFVSESLALSASGSFSVYTKGLNYLPQVTGTAYNAAQVSGLPNHPALLAERIAGGQITQTQGSAQNFSFQYTLPDNQSQVISEIVWGQFTNGYFDGRPAVCGPGGAPVTFAVTGPAGKKLKVEIVDVNGKVADYLLNLTGAKRNYSLATSGPALPEGFDMTRVAMIRFVADKLNMGLSGTVAVESAGLFYDPNAIGSSPALTPSHVQPLPTDGRQQGSQLYPVVTTVAPPSTLATASATSRGLIFVYETRIAGWAGTGFTFDNFSTAGIETGNLSNLNQLTFGIKGSSDRVKMEVVDNQGRKVSVLLSGILGNAEQVWSIPVSRFSGVDLTQVRTIYFIVEGTQKIGNLEINQYPQGSSWPAVYQSSIEIMALPGNPANNTIVPAGATATMTTTPRGGLLTYNTGTAGWAGGGFNYDNFSTSAIETGDLSLYEKLIFGLKGSPSRVKLEVIDDQNRKAAVYLLQTNYGGFENEWAVSTADLRATGVNLSRVRMIYFIVEGAQQSGTLEINRMPTAVQPNLAAMIQPLPNNPVPRIVSIAPSTGGALASSASAITRGARLNYSTGTSGWAGAGFTYDDPATTAVESADLRSMPYLGFGLKGNPSQVKLEIVDAQGRKASVQFTGIRIDQEQQWAISLLPFEAYGIDLSRVRSIYFIVQGQNQTGSLQIFNMLG